MRKYIKYFIVLMVLACGVTFSSTKAATGYTYANDGQPIHSTVGFNASSSSIFTIMSDGWKGIQVDKFESPEDMFLFTENVNGVEQDVIYIVDSKSNLLYVFDENLSLRSGSEGIISSFEVRPENFTKREFDSIRTNVSGSSKQLNSIVSWSKFEEAKLTPHENRSADQKWYISLLNVSGVYRGVRPLRDSNGVIQNDQYQDLIYLSDKGNNQIVIVDAKDYHVVQVVSTPKDATFGGKVFAPLKVITDVTGRMFVISEGVYEGIMQMGYNGEFMSYVGVNYVTLSAWDIFWRKISTEAQLSQMSSILNTEFKNLTIDKEGFIYTVSRAVTSESGAVDASEMIKRINPAGKDKLTRNGYFPPAGDLMIILTGTDARLKGPSRFTSIAVNEYGVYTVADEKSGRLFTYDDEGNLLYISGGSGVELNNINNPVAIRYQGENILVLDKYSKAVIRFEPTDIAKVINRAVQYQYEGDLIESAEEWKNVVAENPNYELAYIGIGKSLLREGRHEEAMAYFRIGSSQNYYSKAYKLYRDEKIKENFTFIMVGAVVVIGGFVALNIYRNKTKKKSSIAEAGDE